MLHVHEDHHRRDGGRSYRDDPVKVPLTASIVPLDEPLTLATEGEYSAGYAEIYIDMNDLSNKYGLDEILVQKDYVEYDGKLWKVLKQQDYAMYTNVGVFLLAKMPDEFND